MRVQLCGNGKQPRFLVHRLVAELYIDNPNNYPQVNHLDGNKKNNHALSLEWCSASQNHKHSFMFLGRKKTRLIGDKNPKCKISELELAQVRDLAGVMTHKEIGSLYGLNKKYVGMILRGERR